MKNTLIKQDHHQTITEVNKVSEPLTYYGLSPDIHIDYISDIHLEHHLNGYGTLRKMLKSVTAGLAESMQFNSIRIIAGDLATDPNLVIAFFRQLHVYCNVMGFKYFKKHLNELQNESQNQTISSRHFKLMRQRDALLERGVDFLPAYLQNALTRINNSIYQIEDKIRNYNNSEHRLEKQMGKPLNEISLADYELGKLKDIYFVLGNHECAAFSSVKEAVDFYKAELSKFGINVLHNEYVEDTRTAYTIGQPDSIKQVNCIIYGGIGFAKYDNKWNANNTLCCKNFNKSLEIAETEKFEKGYAKALALSKQKGVPLICISHYPINSCMNDHFDKEVIYFTGHNHNNEFIKEANKVLYADNQVGYKGKSILFSQATIGTIINPYHELDDGMHKTTLDDYKKFYRYIGEQAHFNRLSQILDSPVKSFYLIKQKGYYGFFILTREGSNKGISLACGGKTKRITNSTDLKMIEENFSQVIDKYLAMLTPLRRKQLQLSNEIQELGLSGKIHGCIVDIDRYHHVIVNPTDGNVQFYYSEDYGILRYLNTFNQVLNSMVKNCELPIAVRSEIRKKINQQKKLKNTNGILESPTISNKSLQSQYLIAQGSTVKTTSRAMHYVDTKDGAYGVSRKISPLQRLFDKHVLKDFDIRLIESELPVCRKKSYVDRLFVYNETLYKIVQDDLTDVIIAEEQDFHDNVKNDIIMDEDLVVDSRWLKPTGRYRTFVLNDLKHKIVNKNNLDVYWVHTFSQETLKAIEEAELIRNDPNAKSYNSFEELVNALKEE